MNEHHTPIFVFVQLLPFLFAGFFAFLLLVALMPLAWDHGGWIGEYIDVLLTVAIAAGFLLLLVRCYTLASYWLRRKDIVHVSDITVRINPDGTYDHLSAELEKAKRGGEVFVEAEEEQEPKDEFIIEKDLRETVLEMKEQGLGRKTILDSLRPGYPFLTEHAVRKILESQREDKWDKFAREKLAAEMREREAV